MAAPSVSGISLVGNVAAVQTPSGDTRLYYQQADYGIYEAGVSGPFTKGGVLQGTELRVTAEVALAGTPIAATSTADFSEIHVYFVSPQNFLSHFYLSGGQWHTGTLASYKVTVKPGSPIFYAMRSDHEGQVQRVGFVNEAGELMEANYMPSTRWKFAPLK
ncbi:hypothetical protein C8J57DRAFT_1393814 [Mycena rebaudengoi]|nr:hypothetical protein C8J57DRAFT_1393814 [Mycena rebaudengoi]